MAEFLKITHAICYYYPHLESYNMYENHWNTIFYRVVACGVPFSKHPQHERSYSITHAYILASSCTYGLPPALRQKAWLASW